MHVNVETKRHIPQDSAYNPFKAILSHTKLPALLIIGLCFLCAYPAVKADLIKLSDSTYYDNTTDSYYVSLDGSSLVDDSIPIRSHEYYPSSEIIDYDDNTHNEIIYGSQVYADSNGTKIEDVYSLKDCEYCSGITLQIKQDKDFPIEILDFNYTTIQVKPKIDSKLIGLDLPLKVVDKIDSKKLDYSSSINSKDYKDDILTLPFGYDKELHYGYNSTIVLINNSAVGDMADIEYYYIDGIVNYYYGSQIKFNISSIPQNTLILKSLLYLYISSIANTPANITYWRIPDQNWSETTDNNTLNAQAKTNQELDTQTYNFATWFFVNITNQTNTQIINGSTNLTIRLEDGMYNNPAIGTVQNGAGLQTGYNFGSATYIVFNDRDAGVNIPYLNITYFSVNSSLGVFNMTYYNITDQTINGNYTSGNGTYLSTVFYRNINNNKTNMLNITLSSVSQNEYTINGSVRWYNFSNFMDNNLLFWTGFDDANNISGFSYYSNPNLPSNVLSMTNPLWWRIRNDCLEGQCFSVINKSDDTAITYSNFVNNNATTNFTLLVWVYYYQDETKQPVVLTNGGTTEALSLAYNSANVVKCVFRGAASWNFGTYNNNKFTMIGCRSNGTHFQSIYNGLANPTPTSISPLGTNNNTLNFTKIYIGNDLFSNFNFSGTMDNVILFNRTLSDAELLELNGSYPRWQPYSSFQSFKSGFATNNYSLPQNWTIAQSYYKFTVNGTLIPKIYSITPFDWNFSQIISNLVCSCGTPNTCINWQWNMSCYCNITSPYYCPYYNITCDSTSGTWGVSTNITARFNFTSFITGQIINLSGLGYLNVT